MRHLAFKPRQSGRTTALAHEIINELAYHDRDVYVVAATFHIAMMVRDIVLKHTPEYSQRVRAISVHSLHMLRGSDARNVYFEHTAYEQANSQQLADIYMIEDRKAAMIWGVP
jgi:hypothetical protein